MQRLGTAEYAFQLCLRGDGRIVGTVTDGDIRRAILAGAKLEDPVGFWVKTCPIVGRVGDDSGNARALGNVRSNVRFLPVADADDRIVEVLVLQRAPERAPVALVMAGGRGQRLGERTRDVPKPLVVVRGKPILEHVLARLEAAGTKEAYVAAHYLADQIDRFCETREGMLRLHLLREDDRLGTAGAVSLLPASVEGDVLVINGDVMSEIDLRALADFHDDQDNDASLAAAHYEIQIPYGVVRADADGRFESIEEKPRVRRFVAAGIYLLGPRIRALAPPGQPIDMPELFNLGREANLRIGVFPIHEYWRDIGRPDDLAAAESEILERGT